jgi:hypothetical protein
VRDNPGRSERVKRPYLLIGPAIRQMNFSGVVLQVCETVQDVSEILSRNLLRFVVSPVDAGGAVLTDLALLHRSSKYSAIYSPPISKVSDTNNRHRGQSEIKAKLSEAVRKAYFTFPLGLGILLIFSNESDPPE